MFAENINFVGVKVSILLIGCSNKIAE